MARYLAKMDALHAAATPGEWSAEIPLGDNPPCPHAGWGKVVRWESVEEMQARGDYLAGMTTIVAVEEHDEHDADLHLIVALRNGWPRIAAVLRAAEAIRAKVDRGETADLFDADPLFQALDDLDAQKSGA